MVCISKAGVHSTGKAQKTDNALEPPIGTETGWTKSD